MIPVLFLEDSDAVLPTDLCRPLSIVSMDGGRSDYYEFTSTFNNVKWNTVEKVFHANWHGKTVKEINLIFQKYMPYEFIRGNLPKDNMA